MVERVIVDVTQQRLEKCPHLCSLPRPRHLEDLGLRLRDERQVNRVVIPAEAGVGQPRPVRAAGPPLCRA